MKVNVILVSYAIWHTSCDLSIFIVDTFKKLNKNKL